MSVATSCRMSPLCRSPNPTKDIWPQIRCFGGLRINAGTIATEMVDNHPFGNQSPMKGLPGQSMSTYLVAHSIHGTISAWVQVSSKLPASVIQNLHAVEEIPFPSWRYVMSHDPFPVLLAHTLQRRPPLRASSAFANPRNHEQSLRQTWEKLDQ